MNKEIKKIQRAASIGLWGSMLVSALAIAYFFLSDYLWEREITANEYTRRLMLIAALVLTVVDMSLVLFTLRRQMPRLRQLGDIDSKIRSYRSLVRSIYWPSLFVVTLVAAFVVVCHENTMIMFLLLLFVLLTLSYPNMYKIKSDLGLTSDEMKSLFGDRYIE